MKGSQPKLPLLPYPRNSQVTSSLTALLLRLLHSLLHSKTASLCFPSPLKNSTSGPYSLCSFQLIAGVPLIQAPSWQHLLPEDFNKNLSSLSRALDHSLEKTKADNMSSLTALPTISAEESQTYQTVASLCFCYVSFPVATS